jgi:dTDP-4-dehydrorhamnose 3,5-epimerase
MKLTPLSLPGAYLVEQMPIIDERGQFSRVFCARIFRGMGLRDAFVQANQSVSRRAGTIRGLHYQRPPRAEAKLVRCLRGSIQDVMVDLRRGSPTFLQWHAELLTEDSPRMVYVPEGFAHGFQALEDNTEVTYQASNYYSPEHEGLVRYDDPLVGITWAIRDVIVSPKDATAPLLDPFFQGVRLSRRRTQRSRGRLLEAATVPLKG